MKRPNGFTQVMRNFEDARVARAKNDHHVIIAAQLKDTGGPLSGFGTADLIPGTSPA